ncbi:hypothetical protein ABT369_40540 [Dactylosporangium sp. NPDC000244]|uniref:hypothetical protein n=1 Tax=Dactylosporangium sp. NPDC000244 TaxID=3154365 RepID=UPI0033255FFD
MSAVVLSATLLASGSAGHSASAGAPRPPVAAPAAPAPLYTEDTSLVLSSLDGQAALSDAPAPVPPPPPALPRPVAGLNQTQMNNAAAIVRQGRAQGVPEKGLVVAVATAMQESDLYNVASPAVPSSMKLPHDAVSTDHDSVGLFQQRASQGWGSVPELMNPAHSAALFYSALARVSGWQSMSVTAAAQAVQRSAYPGAYQKHAGRAAEVVAAIA